MSATPLNVITGMGASLPVKEPKMSPKTASGTIAIISVTRRFMARVSLGGTL